MQKMTRSRLFGRSQDVGRSLFMHIFERGPPPGPDDPNQVYYRFHIVECRAKGGRILNTPVLYLYFPMGEYPLGSWTVDKTTHGVAPLQQNFDHSSAEEPGAAGY